MEAFDLVTKFLGYVILWCLIGVGITGLLWVIKEFIKGIAGKSDL